MSPDNQTQDPNIFQEGLHYDLPRKLAAKFSWDLQNPKKKFRFELASSYRGGQRHFWTKKVARSLLSQSMHLFDVKFLGDDQYKGAQQRKFL